MPALNPELTDNAFSRFERKFFDSPDHIMSIGPGEPGGKARGLAFIRETVLKEFPFDRFPEITIDIPRLTVLRSGCFDQFIRQNDLSGFAHSDTPDDRIAHFFQRAQLPVLLLGDLRELTREVRVPLAVRSSSLLEDAMFAPFAGIYGTKMIPNNQPEESVRFQKLSEAIKFVYASTYFKEAKDYIKTTQHRIEEEKMAVIIQEVVGQSFGARFYPVISGVARSYNFYPRGRAKPKDGVVDLALGLGKTIVDGGIAWCYSPAFPRAKPPFSSAKDLVRQTQSRFWAVNMGPPAAYDPIHETEYLIEASITDAEFDGSIDSIASTYDVQSDTIVPGVGYHGPKVINFAPVLDLGLFPLNDIIRTLLGLCEKAVGAEVEIEFAVTIDQKTRAVRFGLLQVRPMVVSHDQIEIQEMEMTGDRVLAASESVLGNGVVNSIQDVIYVRPDRFDPKNSQKIASELESFNTRMVETGTPYLLIGFGRWGSSDPWLGIPVNWGQICGAKVMVESTLPNMYVDLSQGSHFFHNITSFQVSYFSISHAGSFTIDWGWLDGQPVIEQTDNIRHVRLASPLTVKVDGRSGRGVILK